ncbi:hypothetical protein [Streptomyces sp. NPDC048445]|uniref:hypothetical protein n=1 Tax=Streptomyces sp. NPDC048445 TaxID=3365553 RepID=UPI0037139A26
MKTVIVVIGIVAAVAAGVAGVLSLISLRKRAVDAERPSSWADVEQVRKLALSVDGRAKLVGWLTLLNAVLGLLLACAVLLDRPSV